MVRALSGSPWRVVHLAEGCGNPRACLPRKKGPIDARLLERLERLDEARPAVVEHVVVRQRADVDPGGREAGHISRAHPVVDALARPAQLASGDARLEIDDADVRSEPLWLPERIPPRIGDVRQVERNTKRLLEGYLRGTQDLEPEREAA